MAGTNVHPAMDAKKKISLPIGDLQGMQSYFTSKTPAAAAPWPLSVVPIYALAVKKLPGRTTGVNAKYFKLIMDKNKYVAAIDAVCADT